MAPQKSALQVAYEAARQRRHELEDARDRKRRGQLTAFMRVLDDRLHAEYGEHIHAARVTEASALEAFTLEKEEAAAQGQHPFPLGTVLVEWGYPRRLYRQKTPQDRIFTGKKGVLEIITAASEHPGNRNYGNAGRGDLVIRLLRKDGSRSKNYISRQFDMRRFWVPEGTDLLQPELGWPESAPRPEDVEP